MLSFKQRLLLLFLVSILLLPVHSAFAQVFDVDQLDFIDAWENVYNIEFYEDYAYLIARSGLKILDISDPANPDQVNGWNRNGGSTPLAINNQVLFASARYKDHDSPELRIGLYSLADPADPTDLSYFDAHSYFVDFLVIGNQLYIFGAVDGDTAYLQIVDVSNSSSPVEIGLISDIQVQSAQTTYMDFIVHNSIAYLTFGNYGLVIVDLNDPSNPQVLNTLVPPSGYIEATAAMDQYLYVALTYFVAVLDISTPASPSFVTSFNPRGHNYDMIVDNNYLYLSQMIQGDPHDYPVIRIVDITDPESPILRRSVFENVGKNILYKYNNFILSLYSNKINYLNVTYPLNPSTGNWLDYLVFRFGSLVTDGNDIFTIPSSDTYFCHINNSDPQDLRVGYTLRLDSYMGDNYRGAAASDDYLYLCYSILFDNRMDVCDKSTGQRISRIYDDIVCGKELQIQNDYMYYINGTLQVNDISDGIPEHINTSIDIGTIIDYVLTDNYIYAAIRDTVNTNLMGYIEILDISTPFDPLPVASFDLSNTYRLSETVIEGDYIYIADNNYDVVKIIDITDRLSPVLVDSVDVAMYSAFEAIGDGMIAFSRPDDALDLYDISDPLNWVYLGEISSPSGGGIQIAFIDGLIYLRDSYIVGSYSYANGLLSAVSARGPEVNFLAATAPAHSLQLSTSPNPFNSYTTITCTLTETTELDLTVYNIIGEQVAQLANGLYPAGEHKFALNATNWASGVYFVRTTVPGQHDQIHKTMLVR